MTREEHILACLSEECAEVIKEVSKIHRFGMNDVHPDIEGFIPNIERLSGEILDVIAVVGILRDENMISSKINPIFANDNVKIAINKKRDKVERYIKYARRKGTVT